MTVIYVALAGEYEESHPLGIFNTLELAKQCVVESRPSYNTEVFSYNTDTNQTLKRWHASVPHYSKKDRTIIWSEGMQP